MRSTTPERLALCRRVQGLPALMWRGQPMDADALAVRWMQWCATRQVLGQTPRAAQ